MAINKRLLVKPPSSGVTPSKNFKTVIYTGNGGTQAITGVGFQPDFVWIKCRSTSHSHFAADSTRGANKYVMPNETSAELTRSDQIQSFNTDGFTLAGNGDVNGSGKTYVAWCWKSGGGTTSSNTDGTNITSTVQVNSDAGLSIVKWTGDGNASSKVGHGLGVKPDMIITKALGEANDWNVNHIGIPNEIVYLQSSNAAFSGGGTNGLFGYYNLNTTTTFEFINGSSSVNNVNKNNIDYIAYCFHNVDGFSKFGSYTGNGSANGPIVKTGFEPAFLMVKGSSNSGSWLIFDNKRNTTNPRTKILYADSGTTETTNSNIKVDFLSNGFQLTGNDTDYNGSGRTYIYMAFAADPDTEAPTLASSFNIETYTGNGAARNIDVGFPAGFVWLKARNSSGEWHNLQDVVRGATKHVYSNGSNAQDTTSNGLTAFTSTGFSLGSANGFNNSSSTYVAWAFKADDNESTIEEVIDDVDAKAIYTLESNANDVTGNYNATASGITYSSGKFGNAATYSGTNASSGSKIYVSNNIYGSSTSTFTVSLWIKCTNTSGEIPIAGNGGTIGGTTGYAIYLNSGKLALTFRTDPNQDFYADTTSINDGAWHHVALTCNNGDWVLYLDNSVNASGTTSNWTGNPTPTFDTYFGNRWNRNESGVIAGQIDQIRIYDSPLTAASITNLYNETTSQNSTLDIGTQAIVSGQSIVSPNANAGFSIVKYEGQTNLQKIPHGLSAAPNMIIAKNISDSGTSWTVYHSALGAGKILRLESTGAAITNDVFWGGSSNAPTATTFTVGVQNDTNAEDGSNNDIIAYCFHDVTGYQKFGSYTGDGSAGKAITTGFKPDFVLIKSTVGNDNWRLYDTRRGITSGGYLEPNRSDADDTSNAPNLTMTATGFTITSGGVSVGNNVNGNLYIYWAVAKNVPSNTTLANSFKAVAYNGNGGTQSITGLGFKPDLVWIKQRSGTQDQMWYDNNRGAGHYISSNNNNAQGYANSTVTSFDSDGFSVGSSNSENQNSQTFVAWCWKAGNTWQSNIDGTIPSTVNANTANGFSIVKWTSTSSASDTIGHGLSSKPDVVLYKKLSSTGSWFWYTDIIDGSWDELVLNDTSAKSDFSGTYATSTTFKSVTSSAGADWISYCFHSVAGYSKFGKFNGTSSTQSITGLGFQPDWVMIKRYDGTENWYIQDSVRGSTKQVYSNLNNAEYDETGAITSFDSDGWTMGSYNGINNSGESYIYMAIKMN
jgi:hypothetical protein